jgi:Tfp pilus tip-associated adhesin PilY1
MNKMLSALVLVALLMGAFAQQECQASNYTLLSKSGSINAQYACSPPYLQQKAKPNIHFVLDYSGSMGWYPYVQNSGKYVTTLVTTTSVTVSATNYTFTRSTGDFNADGWKNGMTFSTTGFSNAANNKTNLVVSSVSSDGLTLTAAVVSGLVNETHSATLSSTNGYFGYFKKDTYYKFMYNSTTPANSRWEEQSSASCNFTDRIGGVDCVSGNLLNYISTNKVDALRQILTGGRMLSGTTDVYQHELGDALAATSSYTCGDGGSCLGNEPTTGCSYNMSSFDTDGLPGSLNILYPSAANVTYTGNITVDASSRTFTRSSGSFTTDGWKVGMSFASSGFANSANNKNGFVISSVSSTVITCSAAGGLVDETHSATITSTAGTCKYLPATKVTTSATSSDKIYLSASRDFSRTGSGSFINEGWKVGMIFSVTGCSGSYVGNNISNYTVAAVTASTLSFQSYNSTSGMTTTTNTGNAQSSVVITQTGVSTLANINTTTASTDATGIIQYLYGTGVTPQSPPQADIELSFFSGNIGVDYSGGTGTYNTVKNQAQANYLNAINTSTPTGGTNTGPALLAAENFFKQGTVTATLPASGTPLVAKANGASDPYYDAPASGTATTANSSAVPCRKSFVVLISDGMWNSGIDPVGPAYDMHRSTLTTDTAHDLRPELSGTVPLLAGNQFATVYSVYAFGGNDGTSIGGRNAMKSIAIFGGYDDRDKNGLPYGFTAVPSDSTAVSFPINTTSYKCNPNPGTWDDGCKEWDKSPVGAHTGLPYNYYEASDGDQLAANLMSAINDILGRVSSGTAASILGNNDNAGAQLLQAMFYPQKIFEDSTQASWLGELQSYWYFVDPTLKHINIREDSDANLQLDLTRDKIVEFTFDGTYTKVNLFKDANGDGIKDSTTFDAQVDPDDVNTLWRGGQGLFCGVESDRAIFTNDPTQTTVASKLPFVYSGTTPATLADYLDVSSTSAATDIIKYARGLDADAAYRSRTVDYTTTCGGSLAKYTRVWKLGDIIDSTPKIMTEVRLNTYNLTAPGGYADASYGAYIASTDYQARGVSFVGANDGMLHAFKTGSNFSGTSSKIVANLKNSDGSAVTDLGKELWAFVPKNALPYLQYLSQPNYSHMFFVDSTPLLADVAINVTNGVSCTAATYSTCAKKTTLTSGGALSYDLTSGAGGTSWRTVLLGAMGLGGATSYSNIQPSTTGVALTINATNKTFTRATGSFVTDKWAVGDVFYASGFPTPANNGIFTVTGVATTVLTCSGATGLTTETGTTAVTLVGNSVKAPLTNLGLSSVFALDVTQPNGTSIGADSATYPQLLWEFSDPRLGYTTVTPAILRVKDTTETVGSPRNGKWFAVLATGPSGPVSGGSFYGNTDERPLTIFVLDLKSGTLLQTFNNLPSSNAFNSGNAATHTQVAGMPSYAFAGSLASSSIDIDRVSITRGGNYSDDAIYIGYTKGDPNPNPTTWNKGGVLRLLTNNDPNPANWKISTLVDGIGPVTTGVQKLQDITAHNLWLYFGTGRYYLRGDDVTNQQTLFGIKDPCYNSGDNYTANCTTTVAASSSSSGASGTNLVDQSTSINTVASSKDGWFINLGAAATGSYPKRVITDPIANFDGSVTFSTFAPSTDVCSYGGNTSIWEVKYDTGGVASTNLMGQLLIQLSTGAFQEVNLGTDFTESQGRETTSFKGTPPRDKPSATSNTNHFPSKRILHIRER